MSNDVLDHLECYQSGIVQYNYHLRYQSKFSYGTTWTRRRTRTPSRDPLTITCLLSGVHPYTKLLLSRGTVEKSPVGRVTIPRYALGVSVSPLNTKAKCSPFGDHTPAPRFGHCGSSTEARVRPSVSTTSSLGVSFTNPKSAMCSPSGDQTGSRLWVLVTSTFRPPVTRSAIQTVTVKDS